MTTKDQAGESLSTEPAISVIVVADYDVGSEKAWALVRDVLQSLARQRFAEPAEYIVATFPDQHDSPTCHLEGIVPNLRVFFGESTNSYGLKNEAMAAAQCELVALLDGDCRPDPDWLDLAIRGLRADPNTAAVSGRTEYPRTTFGGRAMGLLERSYIEAGGAGVTHHIANNGAGFRRSAYLRHPLPSNHGVFASKEQSDALLKAGYKLAFEPRMRVVHDFDDHFDRDHRAGVAHGAISIRRLNPTLPGAWAARLGYASIPVFAIVRLVKQCMHALRFYPQYGVRWFELPLVFVLALRGCWRELPGLLAAVRGQPPPPNMFR